MGGGGRGWTAGSCTLVCSPLRVPTAEPGAARMERRRATETKRSQTLTRRRALRLLLLLDLIF